MSWLLWNGLFRNYFVVGYTIPRILTMVGTSDLCLNWLLHKNMFHLDWNWKAVQYQRASSPEQKKNRTRYLDSGSCHGHWTAPIMEPYCGWKKSCTIWELWGVPMKHCNWWDHSGKNHLPTGAGFLPSTVWVTTTMEFLIGVRSIWLSL